ncbi:MAG: response regulator [Oligoflexus sp.]
MKILQQDRQKNPTILLIEDQQDDEDLAILALRSSGINCQLVIARDGSEALAYLQHKNVGTQAFIPNLILLDLNLPKINGFQVLEKLRQNQLTQTVPVVVLSTSLEENDLRKSYRLGANSYIRKPVDYEEFTAILQKTTVYWLQINQTPDIANTNG